MNETENGKIYLKKKKRGKLDFLWVFHQNAI